MSRQDVSHDVRRQGEEMFAIVEARRVLPDQPEPRLVHKGRRLQGVSGPLTPQVAFRNLPEFAMNDLSYHLESSTIAVSPPIEQLSDVAFAILAHSAIITHPTAISKMYAAVRRTIFNSPFSIPPLDNLGGALLYFP
jgi:hypothetical protein